MEEKIIELLKNSEHPAMSALDINDSLGFLDVNEYKKLEEVLNKMTDEGILYYSEKKKRYLLLENSHLIKGKLLMNQKGFGFVEIGNDRKDVYISKDNLNGARHLDIVLIDYINEKKEGRIIKIIKRNTDALVGTVIIKDHKYYVTPDKKNNMQLLISEEFLKGIVEGHKVLYRAGNNNKAMIEHVIGHKNDVGVDILSYVYANGFSPKFPDEVLSSIENLPDSVSTEDIGDRLDLRNEIIFTIDGDDTKDIDDAISIKKIDSSTYELGVHIADVSHYVTKDSLLDKEAYARGTSVYLVDRVLPMLPHRLSNGICSLNPGVDRLAMSCIMIIKDNGKIISSNITTSVIRSRIQMTYNKVNDILDKGIVAEGYEPYVEHLKLMKELSDKLRKKMVSRGYIEFSSKEAKILVDEECHPIEIKLRNEGTGENMIENFMIAANESVASYVFYRELPGIYRVHDKPDEKRLNQFLSFISSRGYVVNGNMNKFTSKELQNILKQLADKPEAKILNDLAIRSQAKAVYSAENIGHFGLGSTCYSHFTSPIRRYPDLTLHRLLKDYMYNYSEDKIRYWQESLDEIAAHSSKKEQDAQKCERDVDDMKKAEYMEKHIGEEFIGIISGVQEFGVFIELDNTVEGLAKTSDMPTGSYTYISTDMCLLNTKTKEKYSFGDKVKVMCTRANHNVSEVDFKVIEKIED